ncbi:hypothetical protein [Roseiflexus sp.]|uniref:hypothetical protein n=1 Tax=Roseiflexus sp. TaxID=2562120 RepID=UPI0035B540F4
MRGSEMRGSEMRGSDLRRSSSRARASRRSKKPSRFSPVSEFGSGGGAVGNGDSEARTTICCWTSEAIPTYTSISVTDRSRAMSGIDRCPSISVSSGAISSPTSDCARWRGIRNVGMAPSAGT